MPRCHAMPRDAAMPSGRRLPHHRGDRDSGPALAYQALGHIDVAWQIQPGGRGSASRTEIMLRECNAPGLVQPHMPVHDGLILQKGRFGSGQRRIHAVICDGHSDRGRLSDTTSTPPNPTAALLARNLPTPTTGWQDACRPGGFDFLKNASGWCISQRDPCSRPEAKIGEGIQSFRGWRWLMRHG
jgi:hypothetical protein